MISDIELEALNVYEEAGGEIVEGQAAIERIVLNRQRLKFQSDGTIVGTILKPNQFSWAWFAFVDRKYVRVAWSLLDAEKIVLEKWTMLSPTSKGNSVSVVNEVRAGSFHGPLYDKLTDDAVNYLNPRIVPHLPSWASKDKFVCTIGHHDFYRAKEGKLA
jgi:spore germination cell wall hydrolase CwlJ-like protein